MQLLMIQYNYQITCCAPSKVAPTVVPVPCAFACKLPHRRRSSYCCDDKTFVIDGDACCLSNQNVHPSLSDGDTFITHENTPRTRTRPIRQSCGTATPRRRLTDRPERTSTGERQPSFSRTAGAHDRVREKGMRPSLCSPSSLGAVVPKSRSATCRTPRPRRPKQKSYCRVCVCVCLFVYVVGG